MTDVWLEKARGLAPIVAQYRDESERERHLPAPVFEAMRDAGLLSLITTEAFGGAQVSIETAVRVVEAVSALDGAVGWNLAIFTGSQVLSEYLPAAGAREVFGSQPAFISGNAVPMGEAEAVDGGYLIRGRWTFASGSANANWLLAACRVQNAEPVACVLPKSDAQFIDTWNTTGLRGTVSNDFVIEDVFVPAARCFPPGRLSTGPGAAAVYPRPFQEYAAPIFAAVALGIARNAIESFKAMAPGKTPLRAPSTLSLRHTAQQKLGYAEGLVRASRAYLIEVLRRLDGRDTASAELANAVRLAATSAVENAARAVSLVYELGGGTSIYETSHLERCFRDVHVVSHHWLTSPNNYETVGAFFLSTPLPEGQPEPGPDEWLTKALELAPMVAQYRDEADRERRLATPVFEEIRERGFLSMMVSKAFGGAAVSLETAARCFEAVSRMDGSAGWNLCIASGGALMADYLPDEYAREVFGAGSVAGALTPTGQAVAVEGGYRVTGRWAFASGCHNASWLAGACFVIDNGERRMRPDGQPDIQTVFMPARDCTIVDTWDTGGLRGTGSHDFEAQDVFVPAGRHCSFPEMRRPAPNRPSRGYTHSFFAMQSPLLTSVALGIARDAIESFRELAMAKTPRGGSTTLAEQHTVQEALGRAEGLVRSARAFVYEACREADAMTDPTAAETEAMAATLRLAGVQSAANCVQAVDLIYDWAGTSSLYSASRIQRCFRDVHVVSHHISVATVGFEMVGQYLLGGPLAPRR